MTKDSSTLTSDQRSKLDAELAKRGVKFLPGQVVRRIVGSDKGLKVLGATARAKTVLSAKRAAAQKAPAPAPTAAQKAPKADKPKK